MPHADGICQPVWHGPVGWNTAQTICHLGWLWKIHDWTFLAEIQQTFPPWLSMICVCRSSSLHFCEWISGSCTVPPPVQRPCPCCQSCEPSTSRAELSELWLESSQQKQKLPITTQPSTTLICRWKSMSRFYYESRTCCQDVEACWSSALLQIVCILIVVQSLQKRQHFNNIQHAIWIHLKWA